MLYFECTAETMTERLLGRGKTSGRVDDNAETIKKRLDTFFSQTLPVVDMYEKQSKVRKIDASGSIDDVFKVVNEVFGGAKEEFKNIVFVLGKHKCFAVKVLPLGSKIC